MMRSCVAAVALALAAGGCGDDQKEDAAEANLERLRARIEELGGQEAYPVVALELFFAGNDDPASIGPNLDPHPGVETFHRVLSDIAERPEVSAVVLQVNEVLEGEGEWPYVDAAYVITSAPEDDVHEWAAELRPDEPVGGGGGWLYGSPPPGAPPIPSGHHVVTLYWD